MNNLLGISRDTDLSLDVRITALTQLTAKLSTCPNLSTTLLSNQNEAALTWIIKTFCDAFEVGASPES